MTSFTSSRDCSADAHSSLLYVTFDAYQLAISTPDTVVLEQLQTTFRAMLTATPRHLIGDLRIVLESGYYRLFANGTPIAERASYGELHPHVTRSVVRQFIHARPDLIWLHAGGVAHGIPRQCFPGPGDVARVPLSCGSTNRGGLICPTMSYRSTRTLLRRCLSRLPHGRAGRPTRCCPAVRLAATQDDGGDTT